MFGLFKTKKQRVQAGGLTFEGSEARFRERAEMLATLKVFISHRWDYDTKVLAQITEFESREAGIKIVENFSFTEDDPIEGPRGGDVSRSTILNKIIQNMEQCDLVVAPSKRTMKPSEWVRTELEVAAFFLKKPIVFVDHLEDQQVHTALIDELKEHTNLIYHATTDPLNLAKTINEIFLDKLH
ncbi:TIR domain-containing protein [Hirschia maritima]|uniref:TIR domain-containing protein n=1 Tax=Hirschia maritima TaxID=1121961 RepID=UPI00037E1434|nr:TIR domain-containing protein [Hirschia maritima]